MRRRDKGDRSREYARQSVRRAEARRLRSGDNGTPETHPLLEQAKTIASRHVRPDRGAVIYEPRWEEAVGVAALALVEGHDAEEAVREHRRVEREWAWRSPRWRGVAPGAAGRLAG
jgi:hypothetical protein